MPFSLSDISLKVPDYGSEQFLSDVGGAAGLVLGMSLTSVIGLLGSGLHANLHLYKAMFRPKIRSDSRGYYPVHQSGLRQSTTHRFFKEQRQSP